MTTMEYAIQGFEQARDHYCKDLEAMSEEKILGSVGGAARKPVDFTFEVAHINRRVAARLIGQEPPANPEHSGEWMEAPEELRTKQAIGEFFRSTCDDLLVICRGMSEEQSEKPVGAPGNERPAHVHLNFLALHAMYHDAQLNFIQSLDGDLGVHW